jgi:hypothetical protein
MVDKGTAITDPKYNNILSYERKTSWEVTSKVVEKPEISVWMILIPIVFIPYMQRYAKYKETSRAFSEGYLYTKKIALDTAYKISTKEMAEEDADLEIEKIVKTKPNADARVLNIFEKQIKEIKLLCQHYLALLKSHGDNYGQLVVNHYKSYDKFVEFLNQLGEAEREVSRAATHTFKTDTEEVPEIIENMENCLNQYRLEEAKKLFY